MKELAKEEGEKSEAKLRGVIEILEGAVSAIAGSWRDPLEDDFLGVLILDSR